MTTTSLVLLSCTGFLITASFIHLIRLDYWWIRIWDFPHLQLTVLTVAGFLAWFLVDHATPWPFTLAPIGLVAAALYQGWLIFPYTPLHRRQVKAAGNKKEIDQDTLRLLTSNVYMENTHTPDVKKLIEKYQPDVVLLLETNETWRKAMEPLEDVYPYRLFHPLENTYGMLLYSRLPMHEQRVRFLIQDDIPSMYAQLELPSGQRVHFFGVHPMPPSPTEHYRSTERDAELLIVGRECRQIDGPVVVAGDLNDVAWSHTTRLFQRISGLLDPRVGRGLFSTFHARYFLLRWPLDHVFVSPQFKLRQLRKLPNCGSDHFPIYVSLAYSPDPVAVTEVPQPEHDDIEEMHDTIERARE